ncbi:MAG: MarR family transcriptional regulator [Xanthobacteraceae bacterium]
MDTETRSRPEGSLETGVWLRLLSCTNIIHRYIRRHLKESYSLTMPRFDLLAQVARPPIGPSLGELSRRLLVTKGNITDIVARLEAVDLIERRRDDTDGRVQYVFLTESGRELYDRILPEHSHWLSELMQEVSEKDLETLFEALGILKAALRRIDEREGGGAADGTADDEQAQTSRRVSG